MTDVELEQYRQRLNTLTVQCTDQQPESRIQGELKKLAREVGASTCIHWVHPTSTALKTTEAGPPELIRNIHQALQTASMANMCNAATKGYKIATDAVNMARKTYWVATAAAWAAAAAAWVAAFQN